jgi:hypothetical protein
MTVGHALMETQISLVPSSAAGSVCFEIPPFQSLLWSRSVVNSPGVTHIRYRIRRP